MVIKVARRLHVCPPLEYVKRSQAVPKDGVERAESSLYRSVRIYCLLSNLKYLLTVVNVGTTGCELHLRPDSRLGGFLHHLST